jgi:hypothetical protein
MALSSPRIIFGVHSFTPYSRSTGEFYGILKVLGGSSLTLSGDLVKLNGGSSKYPWAVEEGNITAEMSLKVKEYPDFLFQLFLGKAPTATGTDATGAVSSPVEKTGTSSINATTGVASVGIIPSTGAANLKFGKYVAKVATTTTIDLYLSTDIDIDRGTDEAYLNDLLSIQAGITIADTSATTDVASVGLRFTGGSGTIGMTVGDTFTFEVKPPSSKSMEVVIGATTDSFPEFGAIIMAKKRSDNSLFEIDALRCKGVGLPLSLEENAYSEAEIKIECFYDADAATPGVLKIRNINPS